VYHAIDTGEGGTAAVIAVRIELFLGEDIPTCLQEGQKQVSHGEGKKEDKKGKNKIK
jgi:hypothetical protein